MPEAYIIDAVPHSHRAQENSLAGCHPRRLAPTDQGR